MNKKVHLSDFYNTNSGKISPKNFNSVPLTHKKPFLKSQEEQTDDCESKETDDKSQEDIIKTGSVITTTGKYKIQCLTIIGQIEGHYILPSDNKTTKYEHIIPQLVAIEQDEKTRGLIIILNTVGGDVEAGLAIAELISGMKKPTVSLVLGGGHSIGVPLAVSAKRSFIARSATMTIHPVRMNGLVLGVPQTMSYFEKMQDRIVNFVRDNSNMKPEYFRKLMMNTGELITDMGTVLDGKKATQSGLIDYVGGLSDVIECVNQLIQQQDESAKSNIKKKDGSNEQF